MKMSEQQFKYLEKNASEPIRHLHSSCIGNSRDTGHCLGEWLTFYSKQYTIYMHFKGTVTRLRQSYKLWLRLMG